MLSALIFCCSRSSDGKFPIIQIQWWIPMSLWERVASATFLLRYSRYSGVLACNLVPNWSPYWFSPSISVNLKAPLLRPSDWFRAKYSEWNKMIAMWLLGCNMICWRSCWGGEVDGDSVIIIPKYMLWYVHICSYDVLTFLEQTLFFNVVSVLSCWRFEWYWIYFQQHSNLWHWGKGNKESTRTLQVWGLRVLPWVCIGILNVYRFKWPDSQRRMMDELGSDIKRCHKGDEVKVIARTGSSSQKKPCWPPRRLRTYGCIHLI